VIVKGSATIERLGEARTVLLDKTGTLTLGTPELERIVADDGIAPRELLRLAASADLVSAHSLAEALVRAARTQSVELSLPEHARESPGQGVEGWIGRRRVAVGRPEWVRSLGYDSGARSETPAAGRAAVAVGVDGRLAGTVVLADRLRPDSERLRGELLSAGIREVALVTGDDRSVAEEIGARVGADRVYAEQTPEAKLNVVRALQATPGLAPVVMVGDGVNDAPALALADVGIAMGTVGATVASETADAVIVGGQIGRVADAVRIGRRSLAIARQSVLVGIGLSVAAMGFAAGGLLVPVAGALLQEAIDVGVILNALRAHR
jgi:P-type E1-E2 ATPase